MRFRKRNIMKLKFVVLLLIAVLSVYCDEIDKFASPFYRNSYYRRSWVEVVRAGTINGGYFGKPKRIVHNDIIRTVYSFKLIRKINNFSGVFNVFVNETRRNTYIIIEDLNLSKSATGDMLYLRNNWTLWCIGIKTDEVSGDDLRVFTLNRQRVVNLIQNRP